MIRYSAQHPSVLRHSSSQSSPMTDFVQQMKKPKRVSSQAATWRHICGLQGRRPHKPPLRGLCNKGSLKTPAITYFFTFEHTKAGSTTPRRTDVAGLYGATGRS